MTSRTTGGRRGIVLILVSGILVLMMTLVVLVASLSRAAGAQDRSPAVRAGLAAASGAEYAARRVVENPWPLTQGSQRCRGDDWTFRDGAASDLAEGLNPSFSHGEPWQENGGDPDAYDRGLDSPLPAADLDGDGKFSAASGRLRGGTRPRDLTFSLKITSPEGRIPVNAGCLWADDLHGGPTFCGGSGGSGGPTTGGQHDPNGIPDHKDHQIWYHRGLIHALNNLGALVLPDGATNRWNATQGNHAFRLSWLGNDLVKNRPVGGYASWEAVDTLLAGLSYTPAERELVRPWIDLGPYSNSSAEAGPVRGYESSDFPPGSPVNIWTAPPEVLKSLWMYAAGFVHKSAFPYIDDPSTFGWTDLSTRANLPFDDLRDTVQDVGDPENVADHFVIVIYPEEADALASLGAWWATSSSPEWSGIHSDLRMTAPSLFAQDAADLTNGTLRDAWLRAKADLAYLAVTGEPGPYVLPWKMRAGTWAAAGDPSGWPLALGMNAVMRVRYPLLLQDWTTTNAPFQRSGRPGLDAVRPLGLTLAPPTRFDCVSAGRSAGPGASATVSGSFSTGSLLEFTSQEDFECLGGGTNLAKRGVTVVGDLSPAERHDTRMADLLPAIGAVPIYGDTPGAVRTYPHVASLPRRNRRAFTNKTEGGGDYGFSRGAGAVGLAPLEAGLLVAQLYWADKDGFDQILNSGNAYSEGPDGDFWHESPDTWVSFPLGDIPFPNQVAVLPGPPSIPEALDFPEDTPLNGLKGTVGILNFQIVGIPKPPPPVVQLPGLDGALGTAVQAMSLSGWFGPDSRISLSTNHNPWDRELGDTSTMTVSTERVLLSPGLDAPAIRLTLTLHWQDPTGTWRDALVTEEIAASALAPHGVENVHVVLTVQRMGPETGFRVYLNGTKRIEYTHPYHLATGDRERIDFGNVDEVRLHSRVLSDITEIPLMFQAGRFVRSGTYTSPRYAFERARRLGHAAWSALVPPCASGLAVTPLLRGYAANGTELPGSPIPLAGPEGENQEALGALGPVHAFRYEFTFDAAQVIEPLTDTPVLESLRLVHRPASGGTAWSRWE